MQNMHRLNIWTVMEISRVLIMNFWKQLPKKKIWNWNGKICPLILWLVLWKPEIFKLLRQR